MDCNFCGKAQWEVMLIVAAPNAYICDECIELCNKIILEQARKKNKALIRLEMSQDRLKFKEHKDFYHMWN